MGTFLLLSRSAGELKDYFPVKNTVRRIPKASLTLPSHKVILYPLKENDPYFGSLG